MIKSFKEVELIEDYIENDCLTYLKEHHNRKSGLDKYNDHKKAMHKLASIALELYKNGRI